MTNLPTHPYTGLTALGLRRDGRPIWPVLGGSEPPADPPPADPAPEPPAPKPDDGLGDAGKKAIAEERAARKAAEKERSDLAARLKEIEDRDKSDAEKQAEKLTTAEKRAAEAEARLLRLEVAAEKGLTAAQAKRLIGSTREELEKDADEILADFATRTPAAPKPDPSQGPRGGAPAARSTSLGQAVTKALSKS